MEEIFSKEELMIFLNQIEEEGLSEFEVTEPYFENRLLKVEIKDGEYEAELTGKNNFEMPISKDEYWDKDEIPGFREYKECLISSGFVEYENWDRFKHWIRSLYESEKDPGLSSESIFLTIDTNLAYYRFISRKFPLRYDDMTIDAKDFDYLLSSIVESEIDHHIRDKYGDSDLKMMGMHTEIGDIRYEFRNRGTLETRKSKFATEELNYLRGELNSARVKGKVSKTDSEKNDIMIVESLEEFCWEKNIDVALLSTDRNMGNHAENAEIAFFILEMPHSIPKRKKVDSEIILNLLHDMALMYGVIQVPELSTDLLGIWGGKKDDHYSSESVKAWVNPGSPVESQLKRDMNVLNSLKTF
ncbi:MAG: hypothetical protein KGY68_06255 [Candidatus Thermoplasmatota archaeon]|nr:hypothetical protein [Candidatus Thermoplasmatota archaeon]